MASGLQTATAAITIVRLAWHTYRFFGEVANAQIEARKLSAQTKRVFELVQVIDSRLELRAQERGDQPILHGEKRIEDTVRSSLDACRKCLLRLNRRLRGLSTDEDIDFSKRIYRGARFVLSQDRVKEEKAVETRIQELSTSLHLLQILEHADTQAQLRELRDTLNEALAHFESLSKQTSLTGSPATNMEQPSLAAEDFDILGLGSFKRTIEVAQSISDAHSAGRTEDLSTNEGEMERCATPETHSSKDSGVALRPAHDPSSMGLGLSTLSLDLPSASIHDPAPASYQPTNRLSRLKKMYEEAAEDELKREHSGTAEDRQLRAIDYGEQLERAGVPFRDRKKMRERLADIYIHQKKHAEALKELHSLIQEASTQSPNSTSSKEESPELKLDQARQWRKLAHVRHRMFLASRDCGNHEAADQNIQLAEEYGFKGAICRFDQLLECGHIQTQNQEYCNALTLMIDIYDDQGKVIEAQAYREDCRDAGMQVMQQVPLLKEPKEGTTTTEKRPQEKVQTTSLPRLSSAILSGRPEQFQIILDQVLGSNRDGINERCSKGWTPLMYAVDCTHTRVCGCEKVIDKLIHHEAHINATVLGEDGHQYTALHQASAKGNERMVQVLIRKEANKDACAPYTPLVTAVKHNEAAIVDLLLEYGADPYPEFKDQNGLTLLHHAVNSNAPEALEKLLSSKHNGKFNIEAKCSRGQTPLLAASEKANNTWALNIAEQLLRKHANPNVMDEQGRTPLYYSTNAMPSRQREQFATLLLFWGADPKRTPERHRSKFKKYQALITPATTKSELMGKDGSDSRSSLGRRDSGFTMTTNTKKNRLSWFSKKDK